jgi:hypothetical protein
MQVFDVNGDCDVFESRSSILQGILPVSQTADRSPNEMTNAKISSNKPLESKKLNVHFVQGSANQKIIIENTEHMSMEEISQTWYTRTQLHEFKSQARSDARQLRAISLQNVGSLFVEIESRGLERYLSVHERKGARDALKNDLLTMQHLLIWSGGRKQAFLQIMDVKTIDDHEKKLADISLYYSRQHEEVALRKAQLDRMVSEAINKNLLSHE